PLLAPPLLPSPPLFRSGRSSPAGHGDRRARRPPPTRPARRRGPGQLARQRNAHRLPVREAGKTLLAPLRPPHLRGRVDDAHFFEDRKSTRLNSSHLGIS